MSSDDLRQVLVRISAPAERKTAGTIEPILDFKLTYTSVDDNEVYFLQGSATIEYSADAAKCTEPVTAVRVALTVAESAAIDAKILDLLAAGKLEQARKEKEAAVANLKSVLPLDTSGFVQHLVKLGEYTLQSMKDRSVSVQNVTKQVHWTGNAGIVHRKCF